MDSVEDGRVKPIDILLVEPNPGDTRLFTESFKDGSITNQIYAVGDGESALEFLHQRGEYESVPQPDIILLNFKLPGTSGEDVLARLRGDPKFSEIPVVVLTSSEVEEDIVRSNGVDADHYLQKPVESEDFVDFVQSIEAFWLTIVRDSSK
ncbi:response regulator [Halorarum halophilum]|uniref:Response regulator n=1 Tax=Halorarum halophilum TaxID=2743090 RepID=A0A7D5H1X8_9EURY|nr:response regulator [Halobaculum halophilum]QLG28813.1 response regulator [Halobaculum halophilum]